MTIENKSLTISVVTPLYNNETFLSETIESVVFQKGNFEIEYIIMDNCSRDNSLNIAYKYQKLLLQNPWMVKCKGVRMHIVSEADQGMYDAIYKGFSRATGDIYAYINSDDIYLPGALNLIVELFQSYPKVAWLKGVTSYINDKSTIYSRGNCNLYYREWIKKGVYGTLLYFIQQDSVFWRADLWNKVEGIDPTLRLAGDFSLWLRFANCSDLYSFDVQISCFRKVDNQLSEDIEKYYDEINTIEHNKVSRFERIKIRLYYYLYRKVKFNTFLKVLYITLFPSHNYKYIKIKSDDTCIVNQKSCIFDSSR